MSKTKMITATAVDVDLHHRPELAIQFDPAEIKEAKPVLTEITMKNGETHFVKEPQNHFSNPKKSDNGKTKK